MKPVDDPRLDPEIRAVLQFNLAKGGVPLEKLTPSEGRQAAIDGLAPWKGEPESLAAVSDLKIEGPEGQIPIRIYDPGLAAACPALIYFHGGGWVVCDLDTHDAICRSIAKRAGALVIAVDYRLAPEHKFPAAVVDCYAVTCWAAKNAANLGIDPARLAVGGDSAGGNLATVMCLKSRDQNGPAIALQILVYPVTDLSSFDTPSYSEFADGYHLTKAAMEWFRAHYLASPQDALSPDASPLLALDLRGLPPALIITAECDTLRDEGEAYAQRLEEAGVTVQCTRYAGMVHPFFSMQGAVARARDAVAEIAAAIHSLPSRAL